MKFKTKKTIGWIFLVLALWFIFPIPGPDDFFGLKIYSFYLGEEIGIDNLSSVYLDYMIFSIIVGTILLFFAMYFLNWSWKRLFKKINVGKYKWALIVGGIVVFLIAYLKLDNIGAYILMGIVSIIYYFLINPDKSETLAVFLTPFLFFQFGLDNLLNFVFQRVPIPEILNIDKPVVLWISNTLGFSSINPIALYLSVIVSFLAVFMLTKVLKDKF